MMVVYRIKGISRFKSKKGTACTVVHVVYRDRNVEGYACDHMFVNESFVEGGALKVGAYCNIIYDRFGRCSSIVILDDSAKDAFIGQ